MPILAIAAGLLLLTNLLTGLLIGNSTADAQQPEENTIICFVSEAMIGSKSNQLEVNFSIANDSSSAGSAKFS
jgi:hypothetical protein